MQTSVPFGNAPGLGLNAAGLGLNASGLGLNAAGLGLNAAGLGLNSWHAFGPVARQLVQDMRRPGYDYESIPSYVVTNELTPILRPTAVPVFDFCAARPFTRTTATGVPIRNWRFARTYKQSGRASCDTGSSANFYTSDIEIEVSPSNWIKLPEGESFQLPAQLTSIGAPANTAVDVVVSIANKRESYYACSPDYRVWMYDIMLSVAQGGACNEWIGGGGELNATTFIPAVRSIVPRHINGQASIEAGLAPMGDQWAILVSASVESAAFKAVHYSRVMLDFGNVVDPARPAWQYRYATGSLHCDHPASVCFDGASIVMAYTLALTNLIPFRLDLPGGGSIVAGHPGTITGQSVYVSVTRDGGWLRKPYVEDPTPNVIDASDFTTPLAPGSAERAAPYMYDAAFGPGEAGRVTILDTVRVGAGGAMLRFNNMWNASPNPFESTFRNKAITSHYETVSTPGNVQSPSTITSLSTALFGTFVASAMPVPNQPLTCSQDPKRVEVPVVRPFELCPPRPPPPPPGTGSGSN
ncbi:MAG TPA: hypothetical protein VIV11_22155 [Kofleriaceae bacterium]